MYNSELLYRMAKNRQEEILNEVKMNRQLRELEKPSNPQIAPRLAWALVGPTLAIVLAILIF